MKLALEAVESRSILVLASKLGLVHMKSPDLIAQLSHTQPHLQPQLVAIFTKLLSCRHRVHLSGVAHGRCQFTTPCTPYRSSVADAVHHDWRFMTRMA